MDPLAPAPPGYEQPLQLMHSHHLRCEQRAALLVRLISHLRERGGDDQARQSASHILRYFADTARQHQEDEELDLFPAMIGAVPLTAGKSLRALAEHLAQQHGELSLMWEQVRSQLIGIIAGTSAALDESLCNRFHTLCVAHIEHEESELLPLARRCLAEPALETLGRRMAARRGIALPERHVARL